MSCSSSSRSNSGTVKEGGGFHYIMKDGRTGTFQLKDGAIYDVTDLANTPEKMNTKRTASELIESMRDRGIKVTVLTPKQMNDRERTRNIERENRPDYELGVGIPWGNKTSRKAARRGKMVSRTSKRK